MTFGTHFRVTPRVNVIRGYTGNDPFSFTRSATPKLNEGILSGMVVSLDVNNQWVKGCAAGKVPYIAFHDQADTDVTSSGLLLGFSCAGQFEIETGYFDNGQTYVEGSPLKADTAGNVGRLTLTTIGAASDIVGFASRGGRQDITQFNSEALNLAAPPGGQTGLRLYVLSFITRWSPHGV